ncbi:MAG: hypothetical protein ACTSP4_13555 [Candidatus Hodarchaeales archaeon]
MNRKIVLTMALFGMVILTAGMVVFTLIIGSDSAQPAPSDEDTYSPPVILYLILAAMLPGVILAVTAKNKGETNRKFTIIGLVIAVGALLSFFLLELIIYES